MKQALLFTVLLAVLGIVGFLYRSTLEAPTHNTNSETAICPADAKICPDGTAVSRTGASCQFPTCALPNVEFPAFRLAFALPAGYHAVTGSGSADTSLIAAYAKSGPTGTSTVPDTITVRRYAIPEGKDANSVMLEHTVYEASGQNAQSMQEFKPVIINGKTYQMIGVDRFEGVVHVLYYLPRESDVLRFEITQHDVVNWTDPSLSIRTLAGVAALESMLGTLQES